MTELKLNFNESKTKAILLTRRRRGKNKIITNEKVKYILNNGPLKLYLNGIPTPFNDKIKYLGVIVNENLNFADNTYSYDIKN